MSQMQQDEEGNPSLVGTFMRELSSMREKFKDEDAEYEASFQHLEKAAVLQECRNFNDANFVSKRPGECCELLTKLLYLLVQGDTFTPTEATEVFFGVTRLFQSQAPMLRRMMYLFIKEVVEATAAEEVIIVTSSLTKDVNSKKPLFKANALRVLCKIIDGNMLSQIDRYIKQAIVDPTSMVSSSAIVSGHHLLNDNADIVRRWTNEVQEAMNSNSAMVQYHALTLLYRIKQHDRLAVSKLVSGLSRGNTLHSSLATCMLIRYTIRMMNANKDLPAKEARAAYSFLEMCLRDKDEMVLFEAARAICNLPDATPQDISPAVTALQLFLGSGKPVYRFAAVRTLSQVALKHPMSVTKCNEDMETMIQDSNRSIATLAITTLLKTGGESSVDRLMKQISSFMSEIGDEFKVVIVKAIKVLCLKYPSKHRSMLAFLHNALREEGGFQFKKAIVDAILDLLNQVPEMKIEGLNALGEFIEDCEFPQLSVKILQLLGELAPTTPHPGRYIRFIYNRVILEIPPVRAAAVSALAKLAASVDELRDEVLILLRRAQTDDDDEVRDRATSYVTMLSAKDNVEASLNIIKDGLPSGMSVRALEKALIAYKARPAPGPLSIESLNVQLGSTSERGYEDERVERTTSLQEDAGIIEVDDNAGADNAAADVVDDNYAAELYNIPEFAGLGTLLKSSMPVKLTEDEVEYTVQCIKHTFGEHMVLQFNVNNTIDDQLLKNVQVALELEEEEVWSIHATVACEKIPFGKPDKCYVCLLRNEEYGSDSFDAVSFPCELRFTTHDVDKSTGEMIDEDDEGYAEEFPFEDVEIGPADFMARVNVGNFRSALEQIGNSAEKTDKLALRQFKTIGDAVAAIIDALGMQPCEGTASVPSEAMKHMLMLGGSFCGNNKVLARVQLVVDSKNGGVLIKMGVRSEDEEVTNIVFSCL